MSNRAKKKGRRHRTVNRSPRPVTRRTAVAEPMVGRVPEQKSGPDLDRVLDRLGYRRLRVPAPATPDTRPEVDAHSEADARSEVDTHPESDTRPAVETRPEASPVLAKNTLLTLRRLQAAAHGLTLEQLCEEVGWTPRTVTRHLKTLTDSGLAEQAENGCWLASATAAATLTRQ